jgi:very-short-patch-repair endonuclease
MERETINFEERLERHASEFARAVPFEEGDKFLLMDFTEKNTALTDEILLDTNLFIQYINAKLKAADAKYGIGGYDELRTIYSRSKIFGPGGPSPTVTSQMADGAKAPSQWEGSEQGVSLVKEETLGCRFADPYHYRFLRDFALLNRSAPTQAEAALWDALKTKRFNDYKFRRQHIIDRFIADFVCLKKGLVIEVDGLIHQLPENKESDEQRTSILKERGFRVIRFTNDDVLLRLNNVLEQIFTALKSSDGHAPSAYERKTEQTKVSSQSKDLCKDGPASSGIGMGRSLHLGIDIWGKPYTKVMAPLNGIVHSFAFNNAFGDYGATIILTHNLDGESFHTLYGHLSLNSIKNIQEGDLVKMGDVIAEFGIPFENGQWPPHLHFQIIKDMQGMKGDYPGVCAFSEREMYLANCPDADLILGMMG